MVSCSQRKMTIHRSLTSSKSIRTTSLIMDALHQYIKELSSELETLNKEYINLVPTEVKVERIEIGFLVRVSCAKGGRDLLVRVLETFEEVGLNVLQAKVSCNNSFWMEAIGEAQGLDVQVVKEAVLEALEKKQEEHSSSK